MPDSSPGTPHDANGAATPSAGRALRRVFDALLVAGVLGVLAGPLLMFGSEGAAEHVARTEKRPLHSFPSIGFDRLGPLEVPAAGTVKHFPSQFEPWFADRVGGRATLTGIANVAKWWRLLPTEAVRPSFGETKGTVVIGSGGWLFFAGEQVIDDYRCTAPFSSEELRAWVDVLEARRRWLAERGVEYVVVFAPNKHTVYADRLPRTITRVHPRSRLDQLLEYARGRTGTPLVDPRPALLAVSGERPTYHRTDTHWNSYGALVATGVLVDDIRKRDPRIAPVVMDDYTITFESIDSPFDLALMLHSPIEFDDELAIVDRRSPHRSFDVEVTGSGAGRRRTTGNPHGPDVTAIVVHDSFVPAMEPYLDERFARVDYVWQRDLPWALIERERPDVVVHEYVERSLMTHTPPAPPSAPSPHPPRLATSVIEGHR